MAFTAVLCFSLSHALLETGAKCRMQAIGGHTSGGKLLGSIEIWADTLEGLEGTKKPPQVIPGRAVVIR